MGLTLTEKILSAHIVDGKMSVPLSSVHAGTSGSYARIEIGTNGCIQANSLTMDSPTSELIINLPETGIQSPVIKASMSINAGVKVIFDGQIVHSLPGKEANENDLGLMMAGGK